MVKFITLAGQKQVGKDTSAQMLKQLLLVKTATPEVHVVHFADALKKACHFIFGIPLEDMETEEGKQKITMVRWPKSRVIVTTKTDRLWLSDPGGKNMTVREVLQFVGTDLFRNQLDPDIWLNSVFNKEYEEDDVVIIADARFPNEAEMGSERGILIGIQRDTGIKSDGHKSETALDSYTGYHHGVINDGTFDDLSHNLCRILTNEGLI